MKHPKQTPYGTRKPYCRCNSIGHTKEDFITPFSDYFEGVKQRCPDCRERYYYFTLETRLKLNLQNNLR